MSKRIGKLAIVEAEPVLICWECGKVAETRPYGPQGAEVCFACAQRDPARTENNMGIKLFGERGELQ